jgi:hypothetical protein
MIRQVILPGTVRKVQEDNGGCPTPTRNLRQSANDANCGMLPDQPPSFVQALPMISALQSFWKNPL